MIKVELLNKEDIENVSFDLQVEGEFTDLICETLAVYSFLTKSILENEEMDLEQKTVCIDSLKNMSNEYIQLAEKMLKKELNKNLN